VRHAVGIKNDAEFAGKTTKTRHPQGIKIAKMAKNGQKKAKRNHRAQEMADFAENCRKNEHQKTQTKPPRSRNARFYGKLSENEHQKKHKRNHRAQEMADFMEHCRKMSINKNTNETTALKKWPILWKIVGK